MHLNSVYNLYLHLICFYVLLSDIHDVPMERGDGDKMRNAGFCTHGITFRIINDLMKLNQLHNFCLCVVFFSLSFSLYYIDNDEEWKDMFKIINEKLITATKFSTKKTNIYNAFTTKNECSMASKRV